MRFLRAIGIVLLTILALPLAAFAGVFLKGRTCTPEQLAQELRALAKGDMKGWDRLESVPIKDTRLEALRMEAMKVELPFRPSDRELLAALAQKAEALR
jgi:hypothetical protein